MLKENDLPEGISNVVAGDREIGALMASDPEIPLVSATGSTRMGKSVSEAVAKRLGKSILELGGNNAIIITEHADVKQAIPAIVFVLSELLGSGARQRGGFIIHESNYEALKKGLLKAYDSVRIGDPLDQTNHMGPLIDTDAVEHYKRAIDAAKEQGGTVLNGAEVLDGEGYSSGCYVKPTLVEANSNMDIVKHETFAPILYLMKYSTIDEAIAMQNNVPQGSVFSNLHP